MRIEQLEYLAAVTEHGSLRRASEAMHISQPALSEAVTKLEKELGATLLDRRRTGSRISRQGLDLLQNMTEVLEAVDRLRQAAGQQSVRRRDLRIGTVNTASSSLLAPALRDLHAQHGSGGVEVVNARQVDIQQGLAEGSLDLGLVNVLPGDEVPTSIVADKLIEGTPVACLRADHPLAAGPGERRRPPRRAARPDAARLRDAPLRPPALRRRAARRRRTPPTGPRWARRWSPPGSGSRSCRTSPSPPTRWCAPGCSRRGRSRPTRTTVTLLMLRRRAERVPEPLRDLQTALVRQARAYLRARLRGRTRPVVTPISAAGSRARTRSAP